ncbi:MAG: class I SAM-dependent methyltransferase [Anaerolineae bacterium]|nr:class I SAM-dependent methyltransferase [Anaerolineae bacterium]MDH7472651.1 class I SAM-dependent methyltransferase [Anaerolineae bacterium]
MDVEEVIRRLTAGTERNRVQFREGFTDFAARHGLSDWEGWFSPYDDETYSQVLQDIGPDDVVLDLGAGDLRLALMMAGRVRRVYAVEVNPVVVGTALGIIGFDLPRNLHVVCANALDVAIPPGVTVAVLLMRHCQHFGEYFERLRAAGCRRLITNARWKSGVEVIDLTKPRLPFAAVREGWYACRCGAVGYVGQGENAESQAVEVDDCPACRKWRGENEASRETNCRFGWPGIRGPGVLGAGDAHAGGGC